MFHTNYVPECNYVFEKKSINKPYKLKKYPYNTVIKSLRQEFETLVNHDYTHVTNMPGNTRQILKLANHYGIVYLDVDKYVADYCSKNQLMTNDKKNIPLD